MTKLVFLATLILSGCGQHENLDAISDGENSNSSRASTRLNIESSNLIAKEQFAADLESASEKSGHSIVVDDLVFVSRHDVFSALTSVAKKEHELFAYISLPETSPLYTTLPADYYLISVSAPSGIPGENATATFSNSDGQVVLKELPARAYKMQETRMRRGLHLAVADQKLTLGGCVECSDGLGGWCVIVVTIALSA